jgi:hypothetical protein
MEAVLISSPTERRAAPANLSTPLLSSVGFEAGHPLTTALLLHMPHSATLGKTTSFDTNGSSPTSFRMASISVLL